MIKLAHIADCHLQSQQFGRKQRGEDMCDGVMSALKKAVELGANAILCSGDLLDSNYPKSMVVVRHLRKINKYLIKAGIPMYLTSGNHDNSSPHWASGYEVDGPGGIKMLDDKSAQVGNIKVAGLPYMSSEQMRENIDMISPCDVLMWHGDLMEFYDFNMSTVLSITEFPVGLCKLVAMGHIHVHRTIECPTNGITFAYPGSTELCSAVEDTQKRFYMYTFDDDKNLSVESVEFETRPSYVLEFRTVEDAATLMKDCAPNSFIIAKYSTAEVGIIGSITMHKPEGAMVRHVALPKDKAVQNVLEYVNREMLSLPEFAIQKMTDIKPDIAHPDEIRDLLFAVLSPETDTPEALAAFQEQQLREIEV